MAQLLLSAGLFHGVCCPPKVSSCVCFFACTFWHFYLPLAAVAKLQPRGTYIMIFNLDGNASPLHVAVLHCFAMVMAVLPCAALFKGRYCSCV